MTKTFVAKASTTIKADTATVWDALTNPDMIKQYLFGTEAVSDWKEGSTLTYNGVWEGKRYIDKGKILKVIRGKLLETTYWSVGFGVPDEPENYKKVTYKLKAVKGGTELTITQDNNPTAEKRDHSQKNWETVLQTLKELLEK